MGELNWCKIHLEMLIMLSLYEKKDGSHFCFLNLLMASIIVLYFLNMHVIEVSRNF